MILSCIQNEIQKLYEVSCGESVEDYLLPGDKPAHFLSKHPWLHHSEEALLVEQEEDRLDLGLWLHPELFRWGQAQSWESLDLRQMAQDKTLPKLATLIEGVSHFVYLISKAQEQKPVTQLELELQAEVDKFAILACCLEHFPLKDLMKSLFGEVAWNPHLSTLERERYETALKFASQYCDHLKRNYFSDENLLPELRAFYRMNQAEKIRHIS